MSKNTTAIARGAMLAKYQMNPGGKVELVKIEDASQGNRKMRRIAEKQKRKDAK